MFKFHWSNKKLFLLNSVVFRHFICRFHFTTSFLLFMHRRLVFSCSSCRRNFIMMMMIFWLVFWQCFSAVVGSYLNNCSGDIQRTLWQHCRRKVVSRTMHLTDRGFRRENWRISTMNNGKYYKRRECVQSECASACRFFLDLIPIYRHVQRFNGYLVHIGMMSMRI